MNQDLILKISKRVLIIIAIFSLIFYFFMEKSGPAILGLIFGGIISIVSFKLMDNTLTKALGLPENKARAYTMKHYILRFIIYFVVLLVAALADYLSILTTLIGLMLVKYVIIFSNIFDKEFHN